MSMSTRSPATAASISSVAAEVVRSLVSHRDEVRIEVVGSGREAILLLMTVHPDDMDALNARDGRVLRALRTFVYAVAAKNNLNLQLQVEPSSPVPISVLQPAAPGRQAKRGKKIDAPSSRFQ